MKSPPAPRRHSRSGYSLVEVLVAATVLMVGITGTIITNVASSNLVQTSEETEMVTVALADTVERMKILSPDGVATTFPADTAIPGVDSPIDELQIEPTYPGFTAGDAAITIQLVATWTTFNGQTRTLRLTTAV